MRLLCIAGPFVLVENDAGEVMIAKEGGEFTYINIPVGYYGRASLSAEHIGDMWPQFSMASGKYELPGDQLQEALYDRMAFPPDATREEINVRVKAWDAVVNRFSNEITSANDGAEDYIREQDIDAIPDLIEEADEVAKEFGDFLDIDFALDYIREHTTCLADGEILEILMRDYSQLLGVADDGEEEQ